MNEKQLIEFVNWLPTAVPEFKNADPEQIVQALNQMYESEEGQQMLSQLFTAFQESKADVQSQMFKKGGKLGQLVEKAKKGKKMCCKKKEVLQGGMVNKVIEKAQWGKKLNKLIAKKKGNYDFEKSSHKEIGDSYPRADFDTEIYSNAIQHRYNDGTRYDGDDFRRIILNPNTAKADTLYQFTNANYEPVVISRNQPKYQELANQYSAQLDDIDRRIDSYSKLQQGGMMNKVPTAQEGTDTTDWLQSMILDEIPNMNFIQRRQLEPNTYIHELAATREGLANPTLGRMIQTQPNGQSDTTYVRFFVDPQTEPIFTNMTGNAKKQADTKFEGLRDKANSKGAKIRK